MSKATNTDSRGRFCGRAVHGVSNLSHEDMRQIEAHRAKERPTPWAHLARRYAVNEIDLRQLFEGANDNALPVATPPQDVAAANERDERFRALWLSETAKSEIAYLLGMGFHSIDRTRRRLGLPKRKEGAKPNGWTEADDAHILKYYIQGGQTAEAVAAELGRTRTAVIGRAYRNGWTRKGYRGAAA